jgi:hypothetical protein
MIKIVSNAFWTWVDSRAVVRRTVLAFTLWMTYHVIESAWEFATIAVGNHYDGVSTAAIIAAITAPVAALQGFAFQQYVAGRKE